MSRNKIFLDTSIASNIWSSKFDVGHQRDFFMSSVKFGVGGGFHMCIPKQLQLERFHQDHFEEPSRNRPWQVLVPRWMARVLLNIYKLNLYYFRVNRYFLGVYLHNKRGTEYGTWKHWMTKIFVRQICEDYSYTYIHRY